MFAMSESPKFRQITKYKSRIEKRKDRLALRSTASYFFRNTEKRYPYVTKAAAQQQHSSSSAEAQQKQQRRRWWRWRRRRRRRRRQHGKPFFAELSQQHRSPQNIIISTTDIGRNLKYYVLYVSITQIRKKTITRSILAPYTTYVHIL